MASFNEKTIVHLFLPKRTPDRCEDYPEDIEQDIHTQATESLQETMDNNSNSNLIQKLSLVQFMLTKWKGVDVQPKPFVQTEIDELRSELQVLQVGHTIPIYIRQQNCTMLISKFADGDGEEKVRVRVQIFRASIQAKSVMSNVDSLKMTFPETSNVIENERMLSSEAFVSRIYEMASEELALSSVEFKYDNKDSCGDIVRDVAHPLLASDWLVGILVPRHDPASLTLTVRKKVRDQVTMPRESLEGIKPFRRSGMWMSIKIALHLKLVEVFKGDQNTASLIYKIIVLRILVDACKSYEAEKDQQFDLDLACQMVAKVGRRVHKLENLNCGKNCDELLALQVKQMKLSALNYTLEVLTTLNEKIQNVWRQVTLATDTHTFQPTIRSKEELQKDILHEIKPLDEVVMKARKLLQAPVEVEQVEMGNIEKKSLEKFRRKRFTTLSSIMSATDLAQDQLLIWLHDTEQFIKRINEPIGKSSEEIFNLGQLYLTEARKAYKDNPIGFSQMLLVSLKLTCILDKLATRKYEILSGYKPDIDPTSFECLLLPHEHDVNILNELLDYFKSRDADASSSLKILEREVNCNSLCVRYAEQNAEMSKLNSQLQHDIRTASDAKLKEVEEVRKECSNLRTRLNSIGEQCTCQYEERSNENSRKRKRLHKCHRCVIKDTLKYQRKSVSIYEVPLPNASYLRNAIIFELLIPKEISHLRQFLATLKHELLGEPFLDDDEGIRDPHPKSRSSYPWLQYLNSLGAYNNNPNGINLSPNIIALVSTVKPLHVQNPDVLQKSNEHFIVGNNMNCNYTYSKIRDAVNDFWDRCTFSLAKTAESEPYEGLQKYLFSTKHSQNEVLASQSDRHQKLPLNEYVTFGSLRAGHRIQLRNLYMAISSRSLALEKEPVLALILQTIWEVGPRDKNGVREAHLDFKEDQFALQFLEMLEKLVKSIQLKYSTPLVLLAAIFITARIMELNENCRDKCHQLFQEWRKLTETWCANIEEGLKTSNTNTAVNETMKWRMQKVLHEIKMCSMMTYNICCPEEIDNVCKDDGEIAQFLHTISSKNLLARESNPVFSGFMAILRFVEQMIPVKMFDFDIMLVTSTSPSQGIEEGFVRFASEKLTSTGKSEGLGLIKEMSSDSNIMSVLYTNDLCVALDVLTGELLINGYHEMELSSQINEHIEFRRFFQRHLNFRVKRISSCVLRTCDSFHGKHYMFRTYTNAEEQGMDIIEISNNDPQGQPSLVLVAHNHFRGFINDNFIDNYTHWLDPVTETVYFRRIASYDIPYEYKLTRSRTEEEHVGWEFYDEINRQCLMSINSPGFMLLTQALSRLELPEHIHIYMNKCSHFTQNSKVWAQLRRHNLRFNLNFKGFLESVEYPGFQVSENQDAIGTLVGLKNSLVLEDGAKRNIIIPHGRIKTLRSSSGSNHHHHHSCEIALESLSQPTFYIYELDQVLQRIIAKKSISSWLYLAALHATTSSSQPDPFTEMTGTEMAVSILQSARVWSCSPYDKESLEILEFIKGLAPKRNYYIRSTLGESIEMVDWPMGLPTMAAYDGYPYLINNLIQDSLRLQTLHSNKDKDNLLPLPKDKDSGSGKLRLRSYLRHLDKYNDQVRVNDQVMKRLSPHFPKNEYELELRVEEEGHAITPMLTTAYICHLGNVNCSLALSLVQEAKDSLMPFLLTNAPLNISITMEGSPAAELTLEDILSLEFRPNWLKYYSMAISENADEHEFSILLSGLAYRGAPLEQIILLHFIRRLVQRKERNFPPIPQLPIDVLNSPSQYDYDVSEIAEILQKHTLPLSTLSNVKRKRTKKDLQVESHYNSQVQGNCERIAEQWKSFWPCEGIRRDFQVDNDFRTGGINASALEEVNSKLRAWFCARELAFFIGVVLSKLNVADTVGELDEDLPVLETVSTIVKCQPREICSIKISNLMHQESINRESMREARKIYRSGVFEEGTLKRDMRVLQESKEKCERKIEEIGRTLQQSLLTTVPHQILDRAKLTPRFSPTSLLNLLEEVCPDDDDDEKCFLQWFVGALGVLWTYLKKFNRCLHFILHTQDTELKKEIKNPCYIKWSPSEYPEWILLELELDITIRQVQFEVADRMREMPDGGNGVMQLNMGEGKTSVIVPMLCAVLANANCLCRVTVLNSIFKTNWGVLKFALGGLLNRRLYHFPCRRDMQINQASVTQIQQIYEECMEMKGVVLTIPEHRFSFTLLAYDNILKGRTQLGLKLHQVEHWLRQHARDILDESDELLSVTYQMVYTVGKQIQVDGGEVRWLMCQQILDFVQEIAPKLLSTQDANRMEYSHQKKIASPHEFAPLRLLEGHGFEEFLEKFNRFIVEKFLGEVPLHETQMKLVSEFLLEKKISKELHKTAMTDLEKDPVLLEKSLMLVGYINRGILSLALSKRWRVEYGVDPVGFRKMAVPFRAKDVAAERTEFAHPDLAIILTHLSYYYSGLSDEQLEEVFKILSRKPCPEAVYRQWIDKIPSQLVPPSFADFHCFELKDAFQKSFLFDLIRRHKNIIDFWLSHTVFPTECKQYPEKLVMTAANLVDERQRLPITGFSGTNDSIMLLPLTIKQQDLESLQGTNAEMNATILRPENSRRHRHLPMGVTCDYILHEMKTQNLQILIDAGALMLELDNEQVAHRWLEIDPDIDAVVYFSKDNELMVKSRWGLGNGNIFDVPLELSPFQGKLECCGVYLDDQHTRGTDLKFPLCSKACVTIGSRMKREKLHQACMRMRKLGKGQAVTFYLSYEAHNKVLEMNGELTNSAVLDWVNLNTEKFNEDGLVYWAMAAKNYAQRLAAEEIFANHATTTEEDTNIVKERALILAKQCVDQEVTALMDTYGQHVWLETLTDLIFKWFISSKLKLIRLNRAEIPESVLSKFWDIFGIVLRRCIAQVPKKLLLSSSISAEEQQEKELELEKELEVEEEELVERSGKVLPAKSSMNANVKRMIVKGSRFRKTDGISHLADIFKDTTFAGEVQPPEDWAVEAYATEDFITVIDSKEKTDSYLRPMEYFALNSRPGGILQILFISPYEVSELMPLFRNQRTKCPLRMFSMRRFERQNMLFNQPELQLPLPSQPQKKFHVLKSDSRENAALFMASGSLFFNSQKEQESFASFLSLKAKPWTEEDRLLFEAGKITTSGFLVPEVRRKENVIPLGFQKDPMGLVMNILGCRHQAVSQVSHVRRLLEEKTYVKFKNQENHLDDDNEDGDEQMMTDLIE